MPDETLQRRGLFRHGDRFYDSLAAQFRLQEACPGRDIGHLDALLAAIAVPPAEDPGGHEIAPGFGPLAAMVELGRIAGVAFDLPPLDPATGVGYSTLEQVELLTAYFASLAPAGAEPDPEPGPPA